MIEVNGFNLLMALLAGVGVFILVVGTQWARPVRLSHVEGIYGDRPQEPGLMGQIQNRLDAARFGIRAGDFIRIVAILVAAVFVVTFVLMGFLPALVSATMSIIAYWVYLSGKASKATEEYEEQLPQVVSRLVVGARMGNSFRGAAEHAAQFGPLICRDDWSFIGRQLDAGADLEMILRAVSQRRQSQLLNSIFELILVQNQRGVPISDVMPLIQESLAQRTRTIRVARTKLNGPLRELNIVCAAPIVTPLLVRAVMPQFSPLYDTVMGQLIVTGVWVVTAGVYLFLYRSFSADLRRETNYQAGLTAQPRTPLDETRPQGLLDTGRLLQEVRRGIVPVTESVPGALPPSLARFTGHDGGRE